MRPYFWIAACLAVALGGLGLLPQAVPAPSGPSRFALVVGVNEYTNRKLTNLEYAERDASELAAVLTRAGFKVRLLLGSGKEKEQATRAHVEAALAELLTGVGKKDTVLLAFSGHGQQMYLKEKGADGKEVEREVPFFCPRDAVPADPATMVSLNRVLKTLDEKGGGSNLLLVDACRNVVDPDRGARGGVNGSRIDSLGEGTAVFFSCSGRQRARETKEAGGGHGVFFHFVLEGLRGAKGATDERGQVTWDRLVPYVKERVKAEFPGWFPGLPEKELQRPHAIGNLTDDPVLIPGRIRPKPLSGATTTTSVQAAQKAWAEYLGEPVEKKVKLAEGVVLELVLIPAGTFWMGSSEGQKGRFDDEVQHEVEITRAYYLGKYELTQEQYESVTGKNPSTFKGAKLPVESVSWEEADGYTKKLTEKLGSGLVYRLPTEAEWEYACRGGALLKDSLPYHLEDGPSDSLPASAANYDSKSTKPVGSYRPNRFGLYDMHGNAWEWCSDKYGDYPTRKVSDPAGASEGSLRVLRGGGWGGSGRFCRSAYRFGFEPAVRTLILGFRVTAFPSGAR